MKSFNFKIIKNLAHSFFSDKNNKITAESYTAKSKTINTNKIIISAVFGEKVIPNIAA